MTVSRADVDERYIAYQDDTVGIAERVNGLIDTCLGNGSFDLVITLCGGRANTTEKDVRESPVHRDTLGTRSQNQYWVT